MFDENISQTRFAKTRVTLGPHKSAWAPQDVGEIHCVQGALGILRVSEIHICISKGSATNNISAQTNRCDGTNTIEYVVQNSFTGLWCKVSDIEGT